MNEYYPMNQAVKALSGSRKKQFGFSATEHYKFNTASYWDGGSKTEYEVINMLSHQTGRPPCGSYPSFQAEYELKPQELLMKTGWFCGKPSTPRFTCRAEDEQLARKFLGIETVAVVAA